MAINKTARDETEKVILDYLNTLESPELIKKIQTTDKDIPDALEYVKNQVKSRAKHGCAMVTDQEVFGMIIHYFEEDSIAKGSAPKTKAVVTTSAPKKEQPKVEKPKVISTASKEIEGQLSLF